MAGLAPRNADEVNNSVGTLLRTFASTRSAVHQQQSFLAAEDLKGPPFNMSPEDETLIKSALSTLDQTLQAYDMTFVSRLIGLPIVI